MNEIVRKVVSLASLPEDLRAGFNPAFPVEIVGPSSGYAATRPMTRILDDLRSYRTPSSGAVERVRASRAEWREREADRDPIGGMA